MPLLVRRASKIGAAVLVTAVAAVYLYLAFVYHSVNVFAPPERITSLDRTYVQGRLPPLSREDVDGRYPPGHLDRYTLERVGSLPPGHPVYQWQNDEIRGQATTSAFLKWGDKYVVYSLSGAP
ncbi:hypothetical protein RHDE110596_05905 [Prescottella defluvii]|uniref:hypothetical protein n=1 Tax=Prescottella defluvii TaxID=1323361 RepID=UPI0004F3971D|nr:hypothetical protein [Prescottella defluvii]